METKFGFGQIVETTPKWVYTITFLLTKIIIGYVTATNLLLPEAKYEVTLFLTLVVDPFAFGLSKMFGISIEEKTRKFSESEKLNAS